MSGSAVSTPHRWKEMAKAIRTPEYRIAYAGTDAIWRRTGNSSPKIEWILKAATGPLDLEFQLALLPVPTFFWES
jgi:hypothetical protein